VAYLITGRCIGRTVSQAMELSKHVIGGELNIIRPVSMFFRLENLLFAVVK
jgi:hypothetical protein